ncbi:MAG: NtaA/DmoA family FMN-dependent monooxygenase [Cypionkella sp.]
MTSARPSVTDQMNIAVLISGGGNHQGAWRRSASNIEAANTPGFYVALARAAEAAKIDAILFADSPSLAPRALSSGPVLNAFEPLVLTAYLAAFTSRIGLVSSVSTSFSEPYTIARQFASLDRASGGRAGWNIVTSATGEKNYGATSLPDQDVRYAQAAEFVEITKRLWDSWDQQTLKIDRATGEFGDSNDVLPTDFHGKFFDVSGPLNIQRPPQGWPVLFQAGASPIGRAFAADTAEGVFTAQQSMEDSLEFAQDMRARVAAAGRDPRRVKILLGITPIIGETEAEAKALERELGEFIDIAASLRKLNSYMPGVELGLLDLDKPIPREVLPELSTVQGRQSRYKIFADLTLNDGWTLRELVKLTGRSDGHWTLTGSPEQIADQMATRFLADACDGYVVMPTFHPEGSGLFFSHVVPILQQRGLFRTDYAGTTLRSHLGLDIPKRGGGRR